MGEDGEEEDEEEDEESSEDEEGQGNKKVFSTGPIILFLFRSMVNVRSMFV